MPVNISDVDAFTTPIVAPADSDPADRTYVLTIAQAAANRTRVLANRTGGSDGSGEFLYHGDGADAPKTRTVFVGPRAGNGESGWDYTAINYALASANLADLFVDLSDHLRSDMVLSEVHALVKPGASRTATNRMQLKIYSNDLGTAFPASDPTATQLGSTAEDDGSNGRQMVSLTSLAKIVNRSAGLIIAHVRAGNTASTAGQEDRFYGLKLVFTDPGPRNG